MFKFFAIKMRGAKTLKGLYCPRPSLQNIT